MEEKIKKAGDWYNKNANIYKQFSSEVAQIIEKLLKTANVPYHSITQRVKDRDSYLNKCKKDQYSNPVEEIMDVAGIRIIAYTNNDVKKICEIIEEEFEIDNNNSGSKLEKMDDDKVGYLSVHYIAELNDKRAELKENNAYKKCKCEIQVRTLLQHAWAEIEHDRNYKFSGVLPKDIRRRFYLISGVLEMMDREFDALSKEIDVYSKIIQSKTKESDFNIDINTESLSQYLILKFINNKHLEPFSPRSALSKSIIEELIRFGFVKIKDIDQKLTEETLRNILPKEGLITYIGFFRELMILLDAKKYFEVAYNGGWTSTSVKRVERWEDKGIKDIRKYLFDANIAIID